MYFESTYIDILKFHLGKFVKLCAGERTHFAFCTRQLLHGLRLDFLGSSNPFIFEVLDVFNYFYIES